MVWCRFTLIGAAAVCVLGSMALGLSIVCRVTDCDVGDLSSHVLLVDLIFEVSAVSEKR